ncbi:MAG: maltooligosyl trehalose synthase [Frankiales bacterium]|nr:maltooligosyl trehalose synthase [Frankiales bacterium]
MRVPARVPRSTYRLQITADFTLADAAALTGYLVELGVDAVYVSPLLEATTGSTHGYDVVDHRRVDPERGGPEGLAELAAACHRAGLGLVVDIVPNHMGVSKPVENAAWWDLLQHGREAAHASWFDVDWDVAGGRILIPVLGDDADLERDLTLQAGELRYFEHRYPIAPGTMAAGDSAAAVHDRQHYELVSFRRADTEQNYRRFFAVTDLAGLRVEDEAVYAATHAEILRWSSDYGLAGIRIDHPDGLADPGQYLQRLAADAPDAWITVEKITEPGETLPAAWPVAGMTGYDALAEVNSVLVDPAAEGDLSRIYRELTGDERDWSEHIAEGKRMVASTILRAEVNRLARLTPTVPDAAAALTELIVAFGVYRSYLPLGAEHLQRAVELASRRRPELTSAIAALRPTLSDPTSELCVRFQQATGAVMAKGVEDTAYYRYNRFIALNEVGGYPGTFGAELADFHAAQARRLASAPAGMTTLSTHDTKRGEDLRARLAVLAELPTEWSGVAGQLLKLAPVPNQSFGYLLWQTFIATGRAERGRLHAYAEKAMREAADGTGWIDPDEAFEAAVHAAVDAAYDDPAVRGLIADFAARIAPFGRANGLSQKLVQLTMPGVPDVYQGSELWEDSLVDPDNRRPVDFAARAVAVRGFAGQSQPPVLDDTATAKLWLVQRALRARRDRPELFDSYRPLLADGPAANHLLAFDRGGAVTLATRLPAGLSAGGGWRETSVELPPGRYRDTLTDTLHQGRIALEHALAHYPVALLLPEAG